VKEVKDKFSAQAKHYQQFRPIYPELLYQFLESKVKAFDAAWDCGTGNGQVAAHLAENFKQVYANDVSLKQLQEATAKDNILYFQTRSEKTDFPDNKFDLITAAQAAHWFDSESFNKEVYRVAKPQAVIALWGYSLLKISDEADKIINHFYNEVLGEYWDRERRLVEDNYQSIPFPFQELEVPKFEIVVNWDYDQVLGYLNSWSAVQNYIEQHDDNPVNELGERLSDYWRPNEVKRIRFRIFTRIGIIEK
jgi:ubiquinone/menaquinone biosynthesis C-methylase UbiE